MGELKEELSVQPLTEREKEELWREYVLGEAGYPIPCAQRMAGDHEIDLHVAVDLVTVSHCDPYLAERILSSYDA